MLKLFEIFIFCLLFNGNVLTDKSFIYSGVACENRRNEVKPWLGVGVL